LNKVTPKKIGQRQAQSSVRGGTTNLANSYNNFNGAGGVAGTSNILG